MENKYALVVLDFEKAEVNFYGITEAENIHIEDVLFGDADSGGFGYSEGSIQYMVAPIDTLDSNITDVQEAIINLKND